MIYYLLTIVGSINKVTMLFSIVFGIALAYTTLISLAHIEENLDDIKKYRYQSFHKRNSIKRKFYARLNKISAILFAISLSLAVFLPSSKGIAFIYVAPKLIENNNVKETFANIPELAKLGTDYLKELLKSSMKDTDKSVGESKQ